MSREELPLLKARAQVIRARLDWLNRHISNPKHEPETARHIAVIDSDRCLGCGRCVDVCPQGVIVLRPYQQAAGKQVSHQ